MCVRRGHYGILMMSYFVVNKSLETFNVLRVDFNVVVTSTLYPQRIDRLLAFLVNGHAMRKVNDLVFRAVDDENERTYSINFVNTVGGGGYEKNKKNVIFSVFF
jgi:hypothetical protein